MALIGIAVGTEVLCRLSLVVPKAVHKAGFHPTAIFGAMGAGRPGSELRSASTPGKSSDALGNRRQHGRRYHRIPRRGRLDQAAACRLGGTVGYPRSTAGA